MPACLPDSFDFAGNGDIGRLEELIAQGMDLSSHDEFGYTALHAAVSYNQKEAAELLLNRGVSVDIEDFDKDTPLFVAETEDMCRFLLDKGANPRHENSEGVTPMKNALEEGWLPVAALLAKVTDQDVPAESTEEQESEQGEGNMEAMITKVMERLQAEGQEEELDEEELREAVTKVILDELRKSVQ
ncbi:ankyrin repeat-containing domain protein [Syncephalastrum racemosum]|uniref:Ankyrin repeat-containing domain protein n=1 Tax=Syncephalastrum racemosum TaxID=13706 RepID=A0A1X2HVJ4_SYNRA|nr:ankyrin repeat-containing domain protein [Syncephalastrum racemosum]